MTKHRLWYFIVIICITVFLVLLMGCSTTSQVIQSPPGAPHIIEVQYHKDKDIKNAPRGDEISNKVRTDGPVDYFIDTESNIPVQMVVMYLKDRNIPKKIRHAPDKDANEERVMIFYVDMLLPERNPYGIFKIRSCLYVYSLIRRPMFLVSYEITFRNNLIERYTNDIENQKYVLQEPY